MMLVRQTFCIFRQIVSPSTSGGDCHFGNRYELCFALNLGLLFGKCLFCFRYLLCRVGKFC